MLNKYSKTITVNDLKAALKARFNAVGNKLTNHDRMQIAINLKIDLVTVKRYMDGKAEDMRRLELAEQIAEEAEKIAMAKKEDVPMQ